MPLFFNKYGIGSIPVPSHALVPIVNYILLLAWKGQVDIHNMLQGVNTAILPLQLVASCVHFSSLFFI